MQAFAWATRWWRPESGLHHVARPSWPWRFNASRARRPCHTANWNTTKRCASITYFLYILYHTYNTIYTPTASLNCSTLFLSVDDCARRRQAFTKNAMAFSQQTVGYPEERYGLRGQ